MPKSNSGNKFIRMQIDHLVVDRTQYKPYLSQLSAGDKKIFVDIPVDEESMIVETLSDEGLVLSLDGMVSIMVKVADAITAADDAARIKKYGH